MGHHCISVSMCRWSELPNDVGEYECLDGCGDTSPNRHRRQNCRVADAALMWRMRRDDTRGLGDYTESLLQSVGITKERYVAAKEMFGLAPTCGCDSRREWLNRVSDWWRGISR